MRDEFEEIWDIRNIWRKLKVKVRIMTHFCTFGTVTPVLIISSGWFFFLIDRFRSQAALVKVSCTLLKSDSRTRVKGENIFCVSLWQIMSHNGTPPCHDDTHLKSIEDSEATITQSAKHFHTKILYFWQKCTFCGFPSISVHYDRLKEIIPCFSHIWKSESWWSYFNYVWKSVSWWAYFFSVSYRQELRKSFLVPDFITAMSLAWVSYVNRKRISRRISLYVAHLLHFHESINNKFTNIRRTRFSSFLIMEFW